MSRADRKSHGRFKTDAETNRIESGLEAATHATGDFILYYHLDPAKSEFDDIYGEAINAGRVYYAPVALPCIHVTHTRGENKWGELGAYYNDSLNAILAYKAFAESGLPFADIDTGQYENDRIIYDQKVFRITTFSVRGQIQQRDTIISMDATQMKPDELHDDTQFAQWSDTGPTP
jgi:hypothetical protein